MAVSPSFDDNKWYQFTTISTGNGSGLVAAWPTSYPAGSVFGAPFSAQGPDFYNQKWQIFESPIDSSAFVLREEVPGPNVFLGVKVNETCAALSNSSCYLLNPTMQLALDDTSTWYIEPSGDETFYMYNRANGSNYHMDTEPGGSWLWMNSDVTERKTQQWNFTAIEPINNSSFSTVSTTMNESKGKSSNSEPGFRQHDSYYDYSGHHGFFSLNLDSKPIINSKFHFKRASAFSSNGK